MRKFIYQLAVIFAVEQTIREVVRAIRVRRNA